MDDFKTWFKEHGRLVTVAAVIFIAGCAFAAITYGCSAAV